MWIINTIKERKENRRVEEEKKEFCSILFNDLNLGQMLFVQAVVIPEINAVLNKYAKEIAEIGGCV